MAKPNGIRSIVTGIPPWAGHDGNTPRRYFKLGRFTMGNSHGFQFSHGLEYAQQLLYPMPPVWEILAYDVKDGASCTFYELVDVPDLTLKQPWDRTPLVVGGGGPASISGTSGPTTIFTYTVPVGRRLHLSSARVRMLRSSVSTTLGVLHATIVAGGVYACYAYGGANTVGFLLADEMAGGPIIVNPTQSVFGQLQCTDTGGGWQGEVMFNGFLFDA